MLFPSLLAKGVLESRDILGGIINKIAPHQTAQAAEEAPAAAPKVPEIRGVPIDKETFDQEFRPIFFGEVSNRPSDKKDLEGRVIFNTALNRVIANKAHGNDRSLRDVLTEKNQYQAYGGDQYKLYQSGGGNETDARKKQEADAVMDKIWSEIESGSFKDDTNNSVYYSHHSDGSIRYDDTRKLFAN